MRVSELIKIYREEEKDLITPYFTGDFMLMTYLNDALVEFAKKTLSFYDARSAITQLYVSKGQHFLPFDQRILAIKQAVVKETNESLRIISANANNIAQADLLLNTELNEMILTKTYGFPVNLQLRVIRKPLVRLSCDDLQTEIPDINDEDYRVLLYYIKHRALSVSDAELFDPNRAANNLALFEQQCQVIKEQGLRRREATQPIMMESLWSV